MRGKIAGVPGASLAKAGVLQKLKSVFSFKAA